MGTLRADIWGNSVDIRRAILSKVDQFENSLYAGFIMFTLDYLILKFDWGVI